MVVIERTVTLDAPQARVFALIASEEGMRSFVGYGPVPGIAAVAFTAGSVREPGSVAVVTNTDGSTHQERILSVEPPRRFALEIFGFTSAFRVLVRRAEETFELEPLGDGATRIHRRFVFEPLSVLLRPLVAAIVHVAFKRAIERNITTWRERLATRVP